MAENDEEKKQLAALEAKLKQNEIELNPDYFDKYTTIRFLRARKLVVDDAYTMLTNHLKWREDNGVNDILETAPVNNKNFKVLDRYWPGLYVGVDKEGVPVWVDRGGQIDADGILASVPIEDYINYHIYTTEKTMKLKKEISAKLDKNCYQGVNIEDLEGFGRQHMSSNCIDIFKRINAINEANYPECLKVFFAINSPTLVSMAFKLVKGFIDPKTREKILVLGSNYTDDLLKYIDKSELISAYGGSNKSITLKGGGKFSDLKKDGTTYNPANGSIGAGAKLEVPVTVKPKYKGNKISYSFSASGDMKFSVVYQDAAGKKTPVVEAKPCDPSSSEIKGEIVADKDGVYVFVFDNYNSWVKGRTIKYHIIIDKPKQEVIEEVVEEKDGKKKKKKKRVSKKD